MISTARSVSPTQAEPTLVPAGTYVDVELESPRQAEPLAAPAGTYVDATVETSSRADLLAAAGTYVDAEFDADVEVDVEVELPSPVEPVVPAGTYVDAALQSPGPRSMCDWPDPAGGYCNNDAVWVGPETALCDEHHSARKQLAREVAAVKAKTKELIQQVRGSTGDV